MWDHLYLVYRTKPKKGEEYNSWERFSNWEEMVKFLININREEVVIPIAVTHSKPWNLERKAA